jgi:hypothetical protein
MSGNLESNNPNHIPWGCIYLDGSITEGSSQTKDLQYSDKEVTGPEINSNRYNRVITQTFNWE